MNKNLSWLKTDDRNFYRNPDDRDDFACTCSDSKCNNFECLEPKKIEILGVVVEDVFDGTNLVYLIGMILLGIVCVIDLVWYLPKKRRFEAEINANKYLNKF